jgi:hypothetical protein
MNLCLQYRVFVHEDRHSTFHENISNELQATSCHIQDDSNLQSSYHFQYVVLSIYSSLQNGRKSSISVFCFIESNENSTVYGIFSPVVTVLLPYLATFPGLVYMHLVKGKAVPVLGHTHSK